MLDALERAHGIGRKRAISVYRVQNRRLWAKFKLRRQEVQERAGGAGADCTFSIRRPDSVTQNGVR